MSDTTDNLELYLPDFEESGWDDEVNDNFRALDASYSGGPQMLQLTSSPAAGATSFTVGSPGLVSVLPQTTLLIGVGTNQWDIKGATTASSSGTGGRTITVSALDYAHQAGDYVYVLSQPNIPIPASWIGMVGVGATNGSTDAAATNNVAMFNRAMAYGGAAMTNVGSFTLALDNAYYVNDICLMLGTGARLTSAAGVHRSGILRARSGFPFDATGTTQILGVQDTSGGYSTWGGGGLDADTTCMIDTITLDGNNLTDSVLLAVSPQQPGWFRDICFLNASGVMSFAFGNQNYCDLRNLQIADCSAPFFGQLASSVFNVNITEPKPVGGLRKSLRIGAYNCQIYGGLIEESPEAPGPMINLEAGTGITIDGVWISGFFSDGSPGTIVQVDRPSGDDSGLMTYDIRNLKINQENAAVKAIRDIDRNYSILTNELPDGYLHANASLGTAYYKNSSGAWANATSGAPHAA